MCAMDKFDVTAPLAHRANSAPDTATTDTRSLVRDLIALTSLPALWLGKAPPTVLRAILDALFQMLRLDAVYARWRDVHGHASEFVRIAECADDDSRARMVGEAFSGVLNGLDAGKPIRLPGVLGKPVFVASATITIPSGNGTIVAASSRGNYPLEDERTLLEVAANTAAIGLQNAVLAVAAEQIRADSERARLQAERQRQQTKALLRRERRLVQKVVASAQRLERLIQESGDAIITQDSQGWVLSWNEAAERMFGWSSQEVVGHFPRSVAGEDLEPLRVLIRNVIETGESRTYEALRRTKDGGRIPVLDTVTRFLLEDGKTFGVLRIQKDISAHKQVEEQSRALELLAERERIAMNLHDDVIQSLYGLRLSLSVATSSADEQQKSLHPASAQVDEIIRKIRNHIFDLQPSGDGDNLVAGLHALANELRANALIRPDVHVSPDLSGLLETIDAETVTNMLLIAREATSNVIRHAQADSVSIELVALKGHLLLTIRDHGVGFDPSNIVLGEGFPNMRKRARMIGGHLTITSEPGGGAEICLEVPCQIARPSKPVRLLIVDDHDVVRIGLLHTFRESEGVEVVGQAATAREAIAAAHRSHPDVVLMDVRLPDQNGIEACREIRSERPETRVIMLTSYPDEDAVLASIVAGASGYLLKENDPAKLVDAVRTVASGGSLLDPSITDTALEFVRRARSGLQEDHLAAISEQERNILLLIAEGKTNREIASALHLSEHTVRTYISTIFQKLHVSHRTAAAALLIRNKQALAR